MNSKLSASFFFEKLTWRGKLSAKKITKILALKLVNLHHKTGQFTGGAPKVTHGPLHDCAPNRARYSALILI